MTPNKDLDRLLELWHQYRVAASTYEVDFSDEESKEYESLKSQIESKLAQAEKYEELKSGSTKGYEQLTKTNWQNCNPIYCQECGQVMAWIWYTGTLGHVKMAYCPICFENDVNPNQLTPQQELSQLREENQKLKAEVDDLESKVIPLSEGSAMQEMELEQLRPIVQALKNLDWDEITETIAEACGLYLDIEKKNYLSGVMDDCKVISRQQLKEELQSILASSEVKP